MRKISRAQFLHILKNSAKLLLLSQVIRPSKKLDAAHMSEALSPKVAVIKGMNPSCMTRKALDALGGISRIVKPKDTVFIKPNYITGGLGGHDPVTSGEIPHPEVILSVIEGALHAGAKEVIVGEWVERPPMILFGGKEGKEGAQIAHGVQLLNTRFGNKISLINLMSHTSYFRYFSSRTRLGRIAIPNIVAEADVVISIAVLKTHHRPSPVTFGLKNMMGIMPSTLYGEPRSKLHAAGLHQIIVDINKAVHTDLVVISGIYGMEAEGVCLHLKGKPVNVAERIGGGLVIASFDPVAADSVATALITKDWPMPNTWQRHENAYFVHHLRMAHAQGLGEINLEGIRIVGEPLKSVQMSWEMPQNVFPELPGHEFHTAHDPYLNK